MLPPLAPGCQYTWLDCFGQLFNQKPAITLVFWMFLDLVGWLNGGDGGHWSAIEEKYQIN